MRYYLIAGEASGDLHASNLMKALQEEDPEAAFRFFGGDLMQAVGGTLVKHYREMAYMGIIPVLFHLRTILRNMGICREDIRAWQPDVVILVDYPGFNLKIAKFVKTALKLPVYYYISPKIWAWKQYRIKDFRRYVDRMFCILPFEKEFYRKLDYAVDYVGNPSVDAVSHYLAHESIDYHTFLWEDALDPRPKLAILPGSRRQEIKDNLLVMVAVAEQFPDYQPVIVGAPGLDYPFYKRILAEKRIDVIFDRTYTILQYSRVALVTSGTATLEAALFNLPQVVCYRVLGGALVNFVFRHFFHTPFISLVNLIAGREVVQELFGKRFSKASIRQELERIMNDTDDRAAMLQGYAEIQQILGEPGASERTASLIYQSLRS